MPAAIPDYVTEARGKAEALGGALSGFASKGATIQDELKKVLNEATAEGKGKWAEVRGKALSDYLASPDEAYDIYRNPNSPNYVFDPIQANRVSANYVQADEIPFFSANTLFSMMTKQEPELIDAGTRQFQAQANAAQTAYNVARQVYTDLLGEFTTGEEMRRADEQMDIERQKLALSGRKGSGEKESDEIKQIIREAGQLPESERRQYIIDQGYNPSGASFTGLFTPATDWGNVKTQAEAYKAGGQEFTIDPSTGQITPKAKGGGLGDFFTGKWRGEKNVPYVPFF